MKALDVFIAVGNHEPVFFDNNMVELFSLTSLKWQNKKAYPFAKDIHGYSILAVEKRFILFGGRCFHRKVLTNKHKKL